MLNGTENEVGNLLGSGDDMEWANMELVVKGRTQGVSLAIHIRELLHYFHQPNMRVVTSVLTPGILWPTAEL